MNEEWRAVVGYEGLYEVSSEGRVRSLNYQGMGHTQVMKLQRTRGDYLMVGLQTGPRAKLHRVNRLVAIAFDVDGVGPVVNHEDGDNQNNRPSNLKWMTQRENLRHSREVLRRGSVGGGAVRVTCMRTGSQQDFETAGTATVALGLHKGALHRVLSGEYRHTGGFTAAYITEKV